MKSREISALFFLRKFLVIKGQRYQIRDELIYRGYKVDVGVVEIRVDEDGEHKTPFIERVYKEIGL